MPYGVYDQYAPSPHQLQLRTICETNPTLAVKRLLCEIHRLRATIPFADQLCNRLGEIGVAARADTTTKMLLENLAGRLTTGARLPGAGG